MRIATFNINGIKARLPVVLDWLQAEKPDVAVLQEIKSQDATFPLDAFDGLGYTIETYGQKGFNGVALLSKRPVEDVIRGLPGDAEDTQARWIEATVMGDRGAVRIGGLYLPNGNPAPGPKYDYKLAWMERLHTHLTERLADEMPLVVLGDFNVIPEARDAARPEAWRDDALFRMDSRNAWRRILNLGFTEALRETTQADEVYTFWDYQGGAWDRNDGIRIDHILLSPQAADCLNNAWVESALRGREKPSDHVPVWVSLSI